MTAAGTSPIQSIWTSTIAFSLALSVLLYFHSPLLSAVPILFTALYSCLKNEPADKETAEKFFKGFRVGGHRGSPHVFPENSFAGFVQAKKEGADLIEFDVALTKDGFAVLLHDDDLDRTTNLTGPIRHKNLSELKTANVAAKFVRTCHDDADPVEVEGIPSLESVVAWSAQNNVKMLFDIKDYDPALTSILVELFAKYNLYSSSIVCSFFPWVVYRVKRADRRILTGLTWRQGFWSHKNNENTIPRFSGLKQMLVNVIDVMHVRALQSFLPTFLGADLLLTNNLDISSAFVNAQRRKGLEVVAWTVNDLTEMQWMLESLKIPVLTDGTYNIKKLNSLTQFANSGYMGLTSGA